MQKFQGLLQPNSVELPDCVCGAAMKLASTVKTQAKPETERRTYRCAACGHELKLTVWADAAPQPTRSAGL